MNITISHSDSTHIDFKINNKETVCTLLTDKLYEDSDIYEKIRIIKMILDSHDLSTYFLTSKLIYTSEKNIIELFTSDTVYNDSINEEVVDLIIAFFSKVNSFKLSFLTICSKFRMINIIRRLSIKYMLKSRYERVSKTIKDFSVKRDKDLLNFTQFLIRLYSKLDDYPFISDMKKELFEIILEKLDVGCINFLEEISLLKLSIDELNAKIDEYDLPNSIIFLSKYKLKTMLEETKLRVCILKQFRFTIFNSPILDFVEKIITTYNDPNSQLHQCNQNTFVKIVVKYKFHQSILYKNTHHLFLFISSIINASGENTAVISKLNLYDSLILLYKFVFNSYPGNYITYNKRFIENLLKITLKINVHFPHNKSLLNNYARLLNILYLVDSGTFNYIFDTQTTNMNQLTFILLENLKEEYNSIIHIDEYDYIEYIDSYRVTKETLKLIQNSIDTSNTFLYTLELKNKFFETIFMVFDKIYNNDHLFKLPLYEPKFKILRELLNKLNLIIHSIYTWNYDKLISIYGIDYIVFNKTLWEHYQSYTEFNINVDKLSINIGCLKLLIEDNYKDCMDPLCHTFIEEPRMLSNDIIVDASIISKYILEKSENPFNREKLSIDDLEQFNAGNDISNKLKKYKSDNRYCLYITFLKTLKKN